MRGRCGSRAWRRAAPSCTWLASTPPATPAPSTTWKGTWRSCTARSAPAASRPSSPALRPRHPPGHQQRAGHPPVPDRQPGLMRAALATEPGSPDAANEDWGGVLAPGLAVVLDGLSAPDGTGTGCRHGIPWYVNTSSAHASSPSPATVSEPGRRLGRSHPPSRQPPSRVRPDPSRHTVRHRRLAPRPNGAGRLPRLGRRHPAARHR
jgi:hypothetical protein